MDTVRLLKGAEIIAHQLRVQIVTGVLQEGDSLPPESELMVSFGVSRPTLREAIRVLESERLIEIRRGVHGGARIRRPDASAAARYLGLLLAHQGVGLNDVYEAESELEEIAVRSLAQHGSAEDVRALRESLNRGEDDTLSPDARVLALRDFHRVLMERGKNATINLLSGTIRRLIDNASAHVVNPQQRDMTDLDGAQRAHVQLVRCIEARDVEGAAELWRKHERLSNEHMLAAARTHNVLDYLGD